MEVAYVSMELWEALLCSLDDPTFAFETRNWKIVRLLGECTVPHF